MKLYAIIIATLIGQLKATGSEKVSWEHFKGTIYLLNGDSLKGEVLLYPVSRDGLVIKANFVGFSKNPYSAIHNHYLVKWMRPIEIKNIEIELPQQSATIKYEYLPYKKGLCRLLRKNDSVSIYSDMIVPGWVEKYAPKQIILQSRKDTLKMYSSLSWFFHNSKTKTLLRKFINIRYHTSFKKSDFTDESEELDYILAHG